MEWGGEAVVVFGLDWRGVRQSRAWEGVIFSLGVAFIFFDADTY